MKPEEVTAVANHLLTHKTHKYGFIAAPGIVKNHESYVAGGTSLIYNLSKLKLVKHSILLKGRILKAVFDIIGTQERFTAYSAYMPQRTSTNLGSTWDILAHDSYHAHHSSNYMAAQPNPPYNLPHPLP